jgi:predicted RNA-binding protein (virulence factor B family)
MGRVNRERVVKRLADRGNHNAAPPKLDKYSDKEPVEFREGQRVELLICDRTEIGYKAIINDSREGLLYRNEVFQTLRKGQHIEGFIKKVRADGKVDLCLQKPGAEKIGDVSAKIVDALKAQGGFLALDDKSPPDVIYRLFGASKKTYKKAIGALYKKRLILIESSGIRLAKKGGIYAEYTFENVTESRKNLSTGVKRD